MSLRVRIAAVASVSVALVVLAGAVSIYIAVRSDLRGAVADGLEARATELARSLTRLDQRVVARAPDGVVLFGGSARVRADERALRSRSAHGAHRGTAGTSPSSASEFPGQVGPAPFGGATGYVQYIAQSGRVLVPGGQGSSSPAIPLDAEDRAIARRVGSEVAISNRTVHRTHLMVLTEGLGMHGAVMVARPLNQVDSELSELLLILAIVSAGGIALAAALGAVVAKVALAPVSRFTAKTEQLTAESASGSRPLDLSRRLEVDGEDELGRLADSFNRTLDALERSVEAQRQLVADAGHELRTPIASLRANIQVLGEAERLPEADRRSLREDIVSELDELTALVSDVIELARGSASDGQLDEVRLDAIVDTAVERARRRARGVAFEETLEPTLVLGDATRIDRAVSNLLENARKWSPEHGVVEVGLHGGVLSVRDRGPGFDEQDLPHVFDRFYRADRARKLPGSGLGLAIVRQAAEACGGHAEASNALGGGALLRASFGEPIGLPADSPKLMHAHAPADTYDDAGEPVDVDEQLRARRR